MAAITTTTHARWWIQATGDNSTAISPTSATAVSESPAWYASRAPLNPCQPTTATIASQMSEVSHSCGRYNRISMPRIDWLVVAAFAPSRSGSSSAENQKSTASCGITANGSNVSTAAANDAMKNVRHCRVTSR
jgi:hypothetical protein